MSSACFSCAEQKGLLAQGKDLDVFLESMISLKIVIAIHAFVFLGGMEPAMITSQCSPCRSLNANACDRVESACAWSFQKHQDFDKSQLASSMLNRNRTFNPKPSPQNSMEVDTNP